MAVKSSNELREKYPHLETPIYCENGCGTVLDVIDAFVSYKRDDRGEKLLICECCASEEGHIHEADETPETEPVCKCKLKSRRA